MFDDHSDLYCELELGRGCDINFICIASLQSLLSIDLGIADTDIYFFYWMDNIYYRMVHCVQHTVQVSYKAFFIARTAPSFRIYYTL